MRTFKSGISLAILIALLAGCGGGGGGGAAAPAAPVVSTLSFPLLSAYTALNASGMSRSFTATVTIPTNIGSATISCSANGNGTISPATTSATFEGKPALSSTTTLTVTTVASAVCSSATTTQTSTNFFDTNYVDLGYSVAGGEYGVYLTPLSIPASVKVGDNAVAGTETIYTDSTKATISGTSVKSFVIEADTASTAIVNMIEKSLDTTGKVTSTSQTRFRITASAAFTPLSMDVQFSDGSGLAIQFN